MNFAERKLGSRIRAGDPGAFQNLYDQYSDRIMGFTLRLSGSRSDAEDLVQETFLAAYRGRAAFAGHSRPLTWLLGIARRRWRDKRRAHHALDDCAEISDDHLDVKNLSIEDSVISGITVAEALSRLKEPFREAVLLVISQQLTYKEAAEIMEEPVGTVKWRVSAALRILRPLLHEEMEVANGMPQMETR